MQLAIILRKISICDQIATTYPEYGQSGAAYDKTKMLFSVYVLIRFSEPTLGEWQELSFHWGGVINCKREARWERITDDNTNKESSIMGLDFMSNMKINDLDCIC